MNLAVAVITLVVGLLLGVGIAFLLRLLQAKNAQAVAKQLIEDSEKRQQQNLDAILENLKANFGNLSLDALSKSTDEFLKLANKSFASERELNSKTLDEKKSLIDSELKRMQTELQKVSQLMQQLESDRAEKFGELTNQLKATNEQTANLRDISDKLRETLSSTKLRGQWGERMAEDVLRLAGFIENLNYLKNRQISGGTRPDFTFFLPNDLKVNMDVKFPLDNYVRYVDCEVDSEREKYRNDFLKDVKARVKEVTTRDYINPEQKTLDYVLLFIPSEQIYAFIHEQDSELLDKALKSKVVFCSPITLFAVLAVIRQAVDNFSLQQTSNEMLALFGSFKKQWQQFAESLEKLGKRIGDTQKEYELLVTRRRRQLEKPLNQIEELRHQRGIGENISDTSHKTQLTVIQE